MGLLVRPEDPAAIEADWRACLPACRWPYPFLSPTWLTAWWEEFGDGREPLVLAAWDGRRLAGVLPLMREGDALLFAGDTEVCDYMDVAALGCAEGELVAAALRALSETPWRELRLWALREDSPTLPALRDACAELGLTLAVETEDVCPFIAIPEGATWESYLESLDRKDRHELRRKLRKLPQAGAVELETLTDAEDVRAAFDDFVLMHKESRADKAAFMTAPMERFFRRVTVDLAREGRVEMTFLRLGGRRVAGVLCFPAGREMLLYNSGYDPAYAALSVGFLSKALVLKSAIERGFRRFDFLRGPERYKYDLGAEDLRVYRAVIRRNMS